MSNGSVKSAVASTSSKPNSATISGSCSSSSITSTNKFNRTIAQLSSLLSEPASEELAETWFGTPCQTCQRNDRSITSKGDNPVGKLSTKGKGKEKEIIHGELDHECPSKDQINLRIFKRALDSGKMISGGGKCRGIPMRLVVLTLKASWHEDGTWPLKAADSPIEEEKLASNSEAPPDGISKAEGEPKRCQVSIHPSELLLKPSSNHSAPVPEVGPPIRLDPDPEEIAKIYLKRGVDENLLRKPLANGDDW